MEYLGHITGNDGIQMDLKKIESVCELMSEQVKWKWMMEEQNAFEVLKEALTSDGQNWHVVAYGSKALDKVQLNWLATECEGYVIVFFLNKWRHLLLGGRIHTNGDALLRELIARNNVEEETPQVVAAVQVDKFKQNKNALLTDPEFEWIIKAIEGDDQATRGKMT